MESLKTTANQEHQLENKQMRTGIFLLSVEGRGALGGMHADPNIDWAWHGPQAQRSRRTRQTGLDWTGLTDIPLLSPQTMEVLYGRVNRKGGY